MFRNLRCYRVLGPWPENEADLAAELARVPFSPCNPFSEQSSGFESPTGIDTDPLCRTVAGADLLRLRRQTRLIPAAAVNEALPARIAEFEARMGRESSRKERRDLRDEVYGELLPRALLRSDRVTACYLRQERVLAIDASAPARAELLLDRLREALGSLEVRALAWREPMTRLLTQTLLGDGPRALALGRECRLNDPASAKSTVQWTDMDLADGQPARLVRDGLRLLRLGVEFDGVLACVIDHEGALRKVRMPGADAEETAEEDPRAMLDAQFALLTGTVRRLLALFEDALGGSD